MIDRITKRFGDLDERQRVAEEMRNSRERPVHLRGVNLFVPIIEAITGRKGRVNAVKERL